VYSPYKLKRTIGNSYNMDLDDSLNTKKALADLGHMKVPDFGLTTYPDQAMIDGVKSFQKGEGLKVDGVMKPDGPTINRLHRKLSTERLNFHNAANDSVRKPSPVPKPVQASPKVGSALTGANRAAATPQNLPGTKKHVNAQPKPRLATDSLDPKITKRGALLPYGVKAGTAEFALPQIAVDTLKAIQAPADVYSGRKAPTPELARDTALNLNAGSALLGKGPVTRFLASRSARLYNTPDRPARRFGVDYPKGAQTDGAGRLTNDIEGRPIQDGSRVAGRRVVGGSDETLPSTETNFDVIATEATGGPAALVTQSDLGRDVGRTRFRRDTGRPTGVALSKNLPADKRLLVYGHEIGHVIDQLAGEIETKGLSRELKTVYDTLNNGNRSGAEAAKSGGRTTPSSQGYKGEAVPREFMAEAIRAYLENPNYLKTVAPKTAAKIRAAVNANPSVNKIIQFNMNGDPLPAALVLQKRRDEEKELRKFLETGA
jgi:hypothetical protein